MGVALLMLFGSGKALAADADDQRLVMVENSPFMIEQLEKNGYDVGFVGEKYEAAVYLDDASEAKLRADGYTIGQTIEDATTWQARRAQIAETTEREGLASEVARNGLTAAAKAKGAVATPGEVVIMRAYTFSNYAGRFLYVEAHNALNTASGGTRAARRCRWRTPAPNGVYRPSSGFGNADHPGRQRLQHQYGGQTLIVGQTATRSVMPASTCTTARWSRCAATTRTSRPSQVTVRVASSTGAIDTSGATEWTGKALPPRVAKFQKDFITKYMDPTETYAGWTRSPRSSRTSWRPSTCRTRRTATASGAWR